MRASFLRSISALSLAFVTLLAFIAVHYKSLQFQRGEVVFSSFIKHMEQGQFEEAQKEIETAIRLNPKNAHYLAHRALLNERMLRENFEFSKFEPPVFNEQERRNINAAIQSYQQVLELNPRDDCVYHNLGWLYWFLRQRQQAFESLREAIAIDNTIALYHLSLGLLYEYSGEPKEALHEHCLALQLMPGLVDSRFFLELRQRSPELAEKMVADTVSYLERRLASGADPVIEAKLGKLYLYRGSPEASERLKKVTLELPNLSRPWSNLGYSYELQGSESLMQSCYEKALFIDGGDFQTWYRLGKYYDRLHQPRDAIRCYRQAIDTWMNQTSVHASRVRRIYRSSFMAKDDLMPEGLMTYCAPILDVSWTRFRLSQLSKERE